MSDYYRSFFKCKECGYMQTTLAQGNRILEGDCPSCCDGNVDYAPKADREKFAKELLEELQEMVREEGLG